MKLTFKNVFLSVGIFAFTLALVGALSTNKAEAVASYAVATGNWNAATTWSTVGCGGATNSPTVPTTGDPVTICSGKVVTVTEGAAAASVTIDNAGAPTGITMGAFTLAVGGAVTLSAPTVDGTSTLAIGAGTLTANSLAIIGGDGSKISQVTVAAGTLTINATNLVLSGTAANARLTSTGASTISVTTGNLINGGTIAFTGATGTSSVAGTTLISNGGTLTASGATSTYTYTGVFTVNAGGEYEETVAPTAITFAGAINNAGTFTTFGTGIHVWGGTVTNSGTGTFNLTDATIPIFAAATTEGTVNYTGAGQTIQVIGYHNLGLSGSGTKVLGALTGVNAIAGTLTITGPAVASLTGDSTANKLYFGTTFEKKGIHGSSSSTPIATYVNDTYFLVDAGANKKLTVTLGRIVAIGGGTEPTITTYPYTASADTTAPSGTSVSINAGVSTTSSLSSTLTFTAIDATEMMISNDAGFAGASWESYAGSKAWTLTSGDGVKTVYARFRDSALNMSTAVIDAITVSGSGTVAVPNEPVQGCSAGNLFNTSTGALCVNNAVPQGCSGGNAFNTSTGAVCTNNAVLQIPGCGNRATGFSTATGGSCVGNHVTTYTTTTYNFGTTTLKNGSKGEAVKELQRFLNAKLNLGLVVDGSLGPKTIAVIKQWQANNGLTADGLVGAKTKAKMNQ